MKTSRCKESGTSLIFMGAMFESRSTLPVVPVVCIRRRKRMVSFSVEKSSFVYKIYQMVRGVEGSVDFLQLVKAIESAAHRTPMIKVSWCFFMSTV